MFWAGLLIGMFAGGTLGALTMALMAAAKHADMRMDREE